MRKRGQAAALPRTLPPRQPSSSHHPGPRLHAARRPLGRRPRHAMVFKEAQGIGARLPAGGKALQAHTFWAPGQNMPAKTLPTGLTAKGRQHESRPVSAPPSARSSAYLNTIRRSFLFHGRKTCLSSRQDIPDLSKSPGSNKQKGLSSAREPPAPGRRTRGKRGPSPRRAGPSPGEPGA